ncbi:MULTISPECIES: hypothetical protein [unclassified Micromonospora]|uniref:hypothetical protein n=1 Tax=unclassified Micromonospora TaxID=2617518 RepID=UPI001C234543|nr:MULTISPECIES: hypothetical protein [unclassified Micromonospora]MBU8860830.1 hypothetical protein [Micromonospora sp. WMMB482]MDM4780371.1 hypothetical protein [Micromonospora sp. b486]
MFGRRRRHEELRAKFLANRDRVRSWWEDWEIPEVVWADEFNDVPAPWIVLEQDRENWLKTHAPVSDTYFWMFLGRPLTPGVREVRVRWQFGAGHRFEELDVTIVSVCDPSYLAEKLTLAVHQARLKGWREEDAQPVYQWLVEGVGMTPLDNAVRGTQRMGFVLMTFSRFPDTDGDVIVRLTAVETDRAQDGSPLDADGVSIPER